MNKLFVLFFILILIGKTTIASVIEGTNIDYAGKTIVFKTYSDPVTKGEIQLFSIQFDNNGNFKSDVTINKNTFVFSDFGIYRGMVFIEPNKTIELQFPPLREKSFADQKNPFFKPINFWFNIQNDNGINKQISGFETKFSQLTNQYFNQLYFRQSQEIYDSVKYILNQSFPESTNEILVVHKKLKLKILETEVFRLKSESVSETISNLSSDYWNHLAFIDFFEKIFTNRLSFDAKDIKGTDIKTAVAKSDINFLINHVQTKYKVEKQVAELVLLKMLHDGFYSGEFSKNSILRILKTEKLTNNKNLTIRKINLNVIKKLEFLLPGTDAPAICLKDITGNKKCSNETADKYKYLVFADAEMMVCREQLKYLTKIDEQFQKYLEIILVMRNTDLTEMKLFLIENQIPGLKLVDENGEFIQKYKVKSFPACFLFDENHSVIFEATKAPLDGFEQQFGSFLKKELFQRQRDQVR